MLCTCATCSDAHTLQQVGRNVQTGDIVYITNGSVMASHSAARHACCACNKQCLYIISLLQQDYDQYGLPATESVQCYDTNDPSPCAPGTLLESAIGFTS